MKKTVLVLAMFMSVLSIASVSKAAKMADIVCGRAESNLSFRAAVDQAHEALNRKLELYTAERVAVSAPTISVSEFGSIRGQIFAIICVTVTNK